MATSAAITSDGQVELACFEVANQVYGIDVLQIREIIRCQEVTPLPMAPTLIEGVIDLRGKVIPIVDLGRALAQGSSGEGDSARIAIVEVDDLLFGLRVDAAVDVLTAGASEIEAPPALATHSGYETVRAVVRREDAPPVMVISLEDILETVYRSNPRGAKEFR